MIRRCVTFVVLGLIVVTGLVVGEEPPAGAKDSKDESPLRLKQPVAGPLPVRAVVVGEQGQADGHRVGARGAQPGHENQVAE